MSGMLGFRCRVLGVLGSRRARLHLGFFLRLGFSVLGFGFRVFLACGLRWKLLALQSKQQLKVQGLSLLCTSGVRRRSLQKKLA